MNLLKNTAGIKVASKYVSKIAFPRLEWGDVAKQARYFNKVGQTTVVVAHTVVTIRQALAKQGFVVDIKKTDIPYHFEVTTTDRVRNILTVQRVEA